MSWQLHKNSQKRKESREEGVKERRKETCRTQMSGWKQRRKKRVKNAFVCKVCATSALTQEKLEPPHQNEKKKKESEVKLEGGIKMEEDYNIRK